MFPFACRIRESDRVSGRRLGVCLLALATLLVLGVRPASAQTLNRQQIHKLLAQRRLQAAALNIKIQHEQVLLARLQTIAFPTLAVVVRIATLQNALNQDLATVQVLDNQIVLLDQLLALLDQVDAVNREIQRQQKRVAALQGLGNRFLVQQRIGNLQSNIQNLQAVVATLQQQITQIQSQIIL